MLYRLPLTRARWLELLTVGNAALLIAGVSFASLAAALDLPVPRLPAVRAVLRGAQSLLLCRCGRSACRVSCEQGAEGRRAHPGRDLRRAYLRRRPQRLSRGRGMALLGGARGLHRGRTAHTLSQQQAYAQCGGGRSLRRGGVADFRHIARGLSCLPLPRARRRGRRRPIPRPAGRHALAQPSIAAVKSWLNHVKQI